MEKLLEFKESMDNVATYQDLNFGSSCVEPMVRLSGPQGFPPTQGIAHQLHCQKGAEVCLNWYKIFFEVKLIDLLNLALFCQ